MARQLEAAGRKNVTGKRRLNESQLMYTSEIVKYWPEHSDWDLIFLYRKFSEECWSAGWIGTPESMAKDFVRWLRGIHITKWRR